MVLTNTPRVKKQDTTLADNFSTCLTDFQNSCTIGLSSQFAISWWLKISPHLKRFAMLPCEMWNLRVQKLIKLVKQFYAAHFKLHGSCIGLIQLTRFWQICVAVNIHNVVIWLECRMDTSAPLGHAMTLSMSLHFTPAHTSPTHCLLSFASCTFVW